MFHDRIAEAKFASLQKEFGFKTCIETGTHLGYGALHASKVCNVETIDTNQDFRLKAMQTWMSAGCDVLQIDPIAIFQNRQKIIRSYHGNSPDILRTLLDPNDFGYREPVCLYLDAHWGQYLPLLDELKVIAEMHPKHCVIIIHDVKVPGKNFNYDEYDGIPLSYEFVKDGLARINPNFKIYHNEECDPKDEPYSSARGILYATP